MSTWATTGIDVSHWQSTADYAAILQYMEFGFSKATEGTAADAMFNTHTAYFEAHNVPIIGGYHFGRDDVKAADQLAAYLARAGKLRAHFLDVEGVHAIGATAGRYFIDGLHDHGERVGLYASEGHWPGDWGQDWDFVANYNREPIRPYDVWQFGPAASNVDGDRSHHTLAELRALMEGDVTPAPITDETEKLVTTAAGTTWYDVDGTTVLSPGAGHSALPARPSPYGVGAKRAIFANVPDAAHRRIVLVAAATAVPIVPDCSPVTDPLEATIAQLRTDAASAELVGRRAEWDRQNAGATVAPRLLDRP